MTPTSNELIQGSVLLIPKHLWLRLQPAAQEAFPNIQLSAFRTVTRVIHTAKVEVRGLNHLSLRGHMVHHHPVDFAISVFESVVEDAHSPECCHLKALKPESIRRRCS